MSGNRARSVDGGETSVVVPCFNEAQRLNVDAFVDAVRNRPWLTLIFVNDGSTDATRDRIDEIAGRCPERVQVVALQQNRGKGEAVRQGVLRALDDHAVFVGFWDADLATPIGEIDILRAHLEEDPTLGAVFFSRVMLLGRFIERSAVRHYFGRIAATAVSLILGLGVYDTQCGAKLFRGGRCLRPVFGTPFVTRWVFDVEILIRVLSERGPSDTSVSVLEVPVQRWTDVGGSKLRWWECLRAPLDLLRVCVCYRRVLRRGLR